MYPADSVPDRGFPDRLITVNVLHDKQKKHNKA